MCLWWERRRVFGSWGTSRAGTLGQRRDTPLRRYYLGNALAIAITITITEERYTTAQVLCTTCWHCLGNNFFTKVAGRVKRQFGDFSLFCPAEPEEYLDRTYGPSWPHTGFISEKNIQGILLLSGKTHFFNHGTGGLTIPTTFELSTHQPAQPFN